LKSAVNLPQAIFLMGPTAAGKTGLAVELVRRLPCEIISVDSALVYRGMDIGTAKPGPEILARAPHRLIDILDPAEPYSAARFCSDALREMQDIVSTGRVPLLVGGTMLYFRALERGLTRMPSADSKVRAAIEAEAERLGWPALHARLAALDPAGAQRIHPNDPQRIQRALEVYELTGASMSELHARHAAEALPYRVTKLVVAPAERAVLHRRIEARFRAMLEQGLVDEVKALLERGDLHPELPAIRTVGYRQVWDFLLGKLGYAEMVQRAMAASRQLARRQLTWLRAEPEAAWFESLDENIVEDVLKSLSGVSN